MKIKMLETPKGRPEFQKGQTYEFKDGTSEESYARKFIARGWAEPVDKAAEKAAREDQERAAAEAKAAAEQAAKDKAEAEAKQREKALQAQQQAAAQQSGKA
ncbi:hypothetical protein [Bradyrhizobium sp. USDA 4545]|uniref:hypothetical protein n=1 Tax=Bradyrhizobium sp. USDA 4545 TaxID=2817705 RepID=UPI0020A3F928|nr:hypothetical protein [Bradyrhizobium sp. USDA 4545]MCP1832826.1 membrane protein involved in colicin uptake [Bradyrhizobium sp. USDA 4545]